VAVAAAVSVDLGVPVLLDKEMQVDKANGRATAAIQQTETTVTAVAVAAEEVLENLDLLEEDSPQDRELSVEQAQDCQAVLADLRSRMLLAVTAALAEQVTPVLTVQQIAGKAAGDQPLIYLLEQAVLE
jgi:hypothetical protein